MGLIQQAAADAKKILFNTNEFAVPIVFTTPDGSQSITINGLAFKHATKVNDYGEIVNTKVAKVTISEDQLVTYITDELGNILTDELGNKLISENSYPTRNSKNRIDLMQHIVTWADNNSTWTYAINETLPDESLGIIVCKLTDKI